VEGFAAEQATKAAHVLFRLRLEPLHMYDHARRNGS
jgi:hypothetical protein